MSIEKNTLRQETAQTTSHSKRRTKGHPKLPAKTFDKLYRQFGEEYAVEILDRVQEGSMEIEEAEGLNFYE